MAYDPTTGRVVMFGGGSTTANLADTWAYDSIGNTWTELKPAGAAPPPRNGAGMAYDPVTHHLILFAGFGDTGALFNDVWSYDAVANTWSQDKSSGTLPSPRGGVAAAYDLTGGRVITFGGSANVGAPFGDTWAYDPVAHTWTELKPPKAVPPRRVGGAMVYDPSKRRLILFGGFGDTGATLNDTWAYDPVANIWTELKPLRGARPPARDAPSLAYDSTGGQLILFGGLDAAGTVLDDAWAFDPAASSWTQLEPSGIQPHARVGQIMVYDQKSSRLIMFGGSLLNDTWTCAPG
jgi:N-acetylneuraminic acid mutarotase